ncbi:MAG: spore coat protein U domain-containing protein [Deltaproteobacteria bacterium]
MERGFTDGKNRRGLLGLLAAALLATLALVVPGTAQATNITDSLVVSVGNSAACQTANPADVNLGAYSPTGTGDIAGTTSVGVRCNGCIDGQGNNKCNGKNKLMYTVSLSSANGWKLKGSSPTDLIPYRIYKPDGVTLWNATSVIGPTQGANAWVYYTANVKAAQGVDVPVGNYSDTVTVTVIY